MTIKRMSDLDLAGKRVLIREDLNGPLDGDRITSDVRIRAALPTITLKMATSSRASAASAGCRVTRRTNANRAANVGPPSAA